MKQIKYRVNSKKHIFINRSDQGIRSITLKLVPITNLAKYHGQEIIRIVFGMALIAIETHLTEETLEVINHFNINNREHGKAQKQSY